MLRFFSAVLCLFFATCCQAAEPVALNQPALRKPADLVLSADGRYLLTANRGSGTVSVVDRATRKIAQEWQIGQSLVHLLPLPDSRLLALDGGRHEAVLLRQAGESVTVLSTLKLPHSPIRAAVHPDAQTVAVSCLWPRKLVALRWEKDELSLEQELILPFAPRELLFTPDGGSLLAADNFGGKLAIVDAASFHLRHTREFPAHNIRAMILSPDGKRLLFAHQLLNSLAVTNSNDIHWGLLMSNELRWLSVDMVLDPEGDFYGDGFMHPIGEPGRGGGDPTDVAVIDNDQAIVTMGGTSQVGLGKYEDYGLYRAQVGQGPSAVVVAPEGGVAYVACAFDDSISIVDLQQAKQVASISLGPLAEVNQVEQGERLFHDATLSMEGWMSCHSCHTDGHTNGLANDNFSDNSFGAPKRIISLLGKADTAPFGWLAASATMADQVHKSVDRTMQGESLSDEEAEAVAAYIATLPLPPPIDRLQNTHDPEAVAHGRQIFLRNNCVKCHAPPTYTTPKTYDVGLHDKEGNRAFNPPSLRGVGHRTTFFHDASATSLRDVFEIHGHQLSEDLSADELASLLSFLRSL